MCDPAYPSKKLPPTPAGLLPAAVLAPIFLADEELTLLFTQRTMNLKDHQGQISFPGGVRDSTDPDLLATALRESAEEIGLDPAKTAVWGTLTPVGTVTGYWVTPFVALIPCPYDFRLNHPRSPAPAHVPPGGLPGPGRWNTGPYLYKDRTVQVCCWKYQGTVIWGATARMLLDLLHRLGEHPLPSRCED